MAAISRGASRPTLFVTLDARYNIAFCVGEFEYEGEPACLTIKDQGATGSTNATVGNSVGNRYLVWLGLLRKPLADRRATFYHAGLMTP